MLCNWHYLPTCLRVGWRLCCSAERRNQALKLHRSRPMVIPVRTPVGFDADVGRHPKSKGIRHRSTGKLPNPLHARSEMEWGRGGSSVRNTLGTEYLLTREFLWLPWRQGGTVSNLLITLCCATTATAQRAVRVASWHSGELSALDQQGIGNGFRHKEHRRSRSQLTRVKKTCCHLTS